MMFPHESRRNVYCRKYSQKLDVLTKVQKKLKFVKQCNLKKNKDNYKVDLRGNTRLVSHAYSLPQHKVDACFIVDTLNMINGRKTKDFILADTRTHDIGSLALM